MQKNVKNFFGFLGYEKIRLRPKDVTNLKMRNDMMCLKLDALYTPNLLKITSSPKLFSNKSQYLMDPTYKKFWFNRLPLLLTTAYPKVVS